MRKNFSSVTWFVENPRGCGNYAIRTNFSKAFCIVLYIKVLVAGWFSDQGVLSYAYEQDLLHNNNESFMTALVCSATITGGIKLYWYVVP